MLYFPNAPTVKGDRGTSAAVRFLTNSGQMISVDIIHLDRYGAVEASSATLTPAAVATCAVPPEPTTTSSSSTQRYEATTEQCARPSPGSPNAIVSPKSS